MDEGERPGAGIGLDGGLRFFQIDHRSPVIRDHDGGRSGAGDVFLHAPAEDAVLADDHRIARLDQIDEGRFHARRSRRRDRQGQLVARLEGVLQQPFDLIHQVHEGRVEVANGRLAHGGQDARVHVRGAGAHQDAARRVKAGGDVGGQDLAPFGR